MQLIVHDFDARESELRAKTLRMRLPDADIRYFTTRRALLAYVASLPEPLDAPRPICLIDIHHVDRMDRGVHLIRTISRHPGLCGRVAAIAYTRYDHPQRAAQYEGVGAAGVLAPRNIRDEQLPEWLARIAAGESRVVPLGEEPSAEEDIRFLDHVIELFPDLADLSGPAQMEEALRILTVCRLFADEYDGTAVIAKCKNIGVRKPPDIAALRQRLAPGPARRIGAVPHGAVTVDLGAVARHLAATTRERSRLQDVLLVDRAALDAAAPLRWAAQLTLQAHDPGQDGAWIPPRDVPVIRDFLELVVPLLPTRKASAEGVARASEQAIAAVASTRRLSSEVVREIVLHAKACLEDRESDEPDADEPGGYVLER